jgi:hypothetical protein
MPVYEYRCDANGLIVEAVHDSGVAPRNWGELCFVTGTDPGGTDPAAPVTRVMTRAPGMSVETSNSELRNAGFTKLVKRDDGVYENVTAIEGEARYMERGKKETIPHLRKKISD